MTIMLLSIPIELYKYMDMRGKRPIVIENTPKELKEKAREINRVCEEKTGKPFFDDIR